MINFYITRIRIEMYFKSQEEKGMQINIFFILGRYRKKL